MSTVVAAVRRANSIMTRIVRWVCYLVIAVFLLGPAVTIVVLSFSAEERLQFPPREWGLDHYVSLAESEYWLSAIAQSFALSVPAAVIALAIGVPLTLVVYRSRLRGRGFLLAVAYAPLILPAVAYAVAVYTVFIQFRVVGSQAWIIVLYAALSVPFVVIIVGAAIQRLPANLELVAMSLGASKLRASVGITVRLLAPAIAASFVFAFINAFDEATFINFIGGTQVTTLPKAIYLSIRHGVDPLILPIAALLMVFTAVVMTVAMSLRFGSKKEGNSSRVK